MTSSPDEDDTPYPGDLAWVNLDPRAGREQSGHRPVLIVRPYRYHALTSYMIICPITSNTSPYVFKVILPDGLPISGAVLVDQVKSVDSSARGCNVVGRVPRHVLSDIRGILAALLGIPNSSAPERPSP